MTSETTTSMMVRMKSLVEALCHIRPFRRFGNPESMLSAARLIKMELDDMGYPAYLQPFRVDGATYYNVIASVGPSDAPVVIVGAHYDVCGDQPGADDNASAVAVMLEVAARVKAESRLLSHRVEFVAYALEEPPNFASNRMGSHIHASAMKRAGRDVAGMICLEMVGFFTEEPRSQRYPTRELAKGRPTKGDHICVLVNEEEPSVALAGHLARALSQPGLPSEVWSADPWCAMGIDYSDHRNYWEMGYPAVMVTDTGFYRQGNNYHAGSDTPETLDYARMALVAKGAATAVITMGKTTTTSKEK